MYMDDPVVLRAKYGTCQKCMRKCFVVPVEYRMGYKWRHEKYCEVCYKRFMADWLERNGIINWIREGF
jgi:hypothetical protein